MGEGFNLLKLVYVQNGPSIPGGCSFVLRGPAMGKKLCKSPLRRYVRIDLFLVDVGQNFLKYLT